MEIINMSNHPIFLLSPTGVTQDPITRQFLISKSSAKVLKVIHPCGIIPRVNYSEKKYSISLLDESGTEIEFPIESIGVEGVVPYIKWDDEKLYIVSGQVAAAVKLPNVVAPSKLVRDLDDPRTIIGCISLRSEPEF